MIQAVKLPTTTVTRLPSHFDENELELWDSGNQKNFYQNFANQTIP